MVEASGGLPRLGKPKLAALNDLDVGGLAVGKADEASSDRDRAVHKPTLSLSLSLSRAPSSLHSYLKRLEEAVRRRRYKPPQKGSRRSPTFALSQQYRNAGAYTA